jgi:hypothetical protein
VDTLFWAGICIGAVLSFAASIIANVLNGRINSLLEKQKGRRYLKREKRERRIYKDVLELKIGQKDRTAYYVIRVGLVLGLMIFSHAVGAMSIYLVNKYPTNVESLVELLSIANLVKTLSPLTLTLMYVIGVIVAFKALSRTKEVAGKCDDFEDYKLDLHNKFPSFKEWQ